MRCPLAVLSRASLSATASANSVRAECRGVAAVSWTRNSRPLSVAVCPRRHAIAQQTPVARQTIDPFLERGARSQGVLYEVERAARQRLGEMDAESFVVGEGAARRHAVSATASATRTSGSSSLVRPKSRRIGAALTSRLSTHTMRCGSTQPCTDDATTARPGLCPYRQTIPPPPRLAPKCSQNALGLGLRVRTIL